MNNNLDHLMHRDGTAHLTTILLGLKPEIISRRHLDRIQEVQPHARLVITEERDEIEPILEEIDIAVAHFPIPWIPRAKRLRWFQQWGAGTDWLLRHPEIANLDFALTNASGVHSIPISEHILALLLAFARQLPKAFRAQSEGRWDRDMGAFELAGKTMLLIGVGAIGKRTAQIADALGIKVIGMRRSQNNAAPPGVKRLVRPDALLETLPEADFVVLTQPLTEETRNMIDAQAFARMKPTAYLINIGRGGTVDEPALIEALQHGKIAGAGLDVFAAEPLPPDSPLWKMENVIVTAHYSGETPHYDDRAMEIFIDNLERYTRGEPLRNQVDKQRGY